jgi:hypothetical protein
MSRRSSKFRSASGTYILEAQAEERKRNEGVREARRVREQRHRETERQRDEEITRVRSGRSRGRTP